MASMRVRGLPLSALALAAVLLANVDAADDDAADRRVLQQASSCGADQFVARAQQVNDACCAAGSSGGSGFGGGHRRMQSDCSLPTSCPSQQCADVFNDFFEQCRHILVYTAGVPFHDYQQFDGCCQGFARHDCSNCVDRTCGAPPPAPPAPPPPDDHIQHIPGPGDFRVTNQCGVGTPWVPANAATDEKGGSTAQFDFATHCMDHAGDGTCNDECSTAECGLDGGDCPYLLGCAPACTCCMCMVEGQHSADDCWKQGFDCHCMFGRDDYGPCPDRLDDLFAEQLCGDQDTDDPRCLGARTAAMEAACCPSPADCVDGVPVACNRQCAELLLPFVEDCSFKLAASAAPLFAAAIAACESTEVEAGLMFDGSQIITPAEGEEINDWVFPGQPVTWELCYSSFTDELDARTYHRACDDYDRTLTVARNAQGDVFGGYASRTFGVTECCVVDGNECYGTQALTYCYDRNAAGSFIFSLVGAEREPTRLSTTGVDTHYLYANFDTWPTFGRSAGSDLSLGTGGAPGVGGTCSHGRGTAYAQSPDAASGICGTAGDWGHTDLEVWIVEDEHLPGYYTNEDGGAAIEGGAGHIHHMCTDGCCASAPCQNGGRCQETTVSGETGSGMTRGYQCDCSAGFEGNDCGARSPADHKGR